MHVQRMFKMGMGLYYGGNFMQIFGGKTNDIRDLIYDYDLTNLRLGANLIFIKIYFAITDCTTYTVTFRKC